MKNLIKWNFQTQPFVLQISRYEKEGGKEVSLVTERMAVVFRYPLTFWDEDLCVLVFQFHIKGEVLLWLPQHQSWVIYNASKFSKCAICIQHDALSRASCLL